MHHVKEFIVDGVIYPRDPKTNVLTLLGRCGGVDIFVGDVFTLLVKYRKAETVADYASEPVVAERRPVSLRMHAAEVLGKSLDRMPGGYTGAIVVDNNYIDSMGPGWSLVVDDSLQDRNNIFDR